MRMKPTVTISAAGVLLLAASGVAAQPAAGPLPTLKSVGVTCDDFAPIGNGLWKVTHPFDLTNGTATVSLSPHDAYGPNDMIAGLPLAKMLASECK